MFDSFLQSDPWIRFPIYACIGWIAELIFTALCDLIYPSFLCSWNVHSTEPISSVKPPWISQNRDPRLAGYSFIWMFPIYGGMLFLEPIHDLMRTWPWAMRGIVYLILIWFAELISGWLIKKIAGRCPWDYSYSRFSLGGYIRWDFAPVWFGFGFVFEFFHDRLVELTPFIRAAFLG
jgi:uncharacterized membrane protein